MAGVDLERLPSSERVPGEVDRSDPEHTDEVGCRIGVIGNAEIRRWVGRATAGPALPLSAPRAAVEQIPAV